MRTTKVILIVIFSICAADLVYGVGLHREASGFCYGDPNCDEDSPQWSGVCKIGRHQSPVDLRRPSKLKSRPVSFGNSDLVSNRYRDLNFNDEYRARSFYILNNGHTIKLQLEPSSSPEMTGYEQENPYILTQAHFHWGSRDSEGSEHTIRGKRFSLELHLVHYSSKYLDLAEAEKSEDPKAIAVLAVFLQGSPERSCRYGSICSEGHKALRPIIKNLPLKYNPGGVKVNRPLRFDKFLPQSDDAVFRYLGSLTTPNCTEKVIWTVAEKPIPIPFSDVKAFHAIRDRQGHPLLNNYRRTKDIHHRKIEYFRVN